MLLIFASRCCQRRASDAASGADATLRHDAYDDAELFFAAAFAFDAS